MTRRALLVSVAFALLACNSRSPTTPGPGAGAPLVYAAMGASDALGIGAFPLSEGYVYVLERKMTAAGRTVTTRNLGIAGAEVDDFLSTELDGAVAANPDVVTVWTGSNDLIGGRTVDDFATKLDRLLEGLRTRTHALVFVGDLADLTRAPAFRIKPDADVTAARIAAYNDRIRAVVAARGCVLVRLSAMPIDDSIFSIDGFHPSNEGYRRIADTFWAEIGPRL